MTANSVTNSVMESVRYLALCVALGVVAVWASENLFWFIPPPDLAPLDLLWSVIGYSIACGVALSAVIGTGVRGVQAAFLGGAIVGYVAEGVIVGTIYSPLPFFWVWTPLAWHALLSGALVLGVGRAGHALGPRRTALIWVALGVGAAFWAQYWPSERTALPTISVLASYLVGFGGLLLVAHRTMDRLAYLPRPPRAVLWIAPGLASLVWVAQGVADLNPMRVLLPLVMGLLWWTMRRLGQPSDPVSLGAPVPLAHHALFLLAPAIAVVLAPMGWRLGWGTLQANVVVATLTCIGSIVWLGRLVVVAAKSKRPLGAPR